ncbi:MFS transporter [Olivibacter sp. SDN3]|uniref:MFS transporter n=1 Tax=Olivibacter sp. SDN3 TaxID=2764720 RepID=UPI001650F8F5|nr:MFS transporter [Olivibacter sp. SDN3]QNL50045.1 MFS transporter [Olivibacter sp. SDN3]
MRNLTLFMSICCGLTVANLYYCQPLLPLIAHDFGVSETMAGSITYITQLGYAAGLLFFVPLGDLFERKQQIVVTTTISIVALLTAAFAKSFLLLQILCFLIGLFSVVPQLIIPLAATLVSNEKRGKTIGVLMGGLLIGIVSSRSLSGYVGHVLGWRQMYFIAATMCFILVLIMRKTFPKNTPTYTGNYRDLLLSIFNYVKTYPLLRTATISGAISFACLSAFWVTMVLLLTDKPFEFNTVEIGLFGLIGASGALAAPLIGKRSSGNNTTVRKISLFGLLLQLLGYIGFYFTNNHIFLLIVGIILIDIGHQALQISNQTLIYSLNPDARNRFNTVFMTATFLGGALGSAMGICLFLIGGWEVFCVGISLLILINAYFNWLKR